MFKSPIGRPCIVSDVDGSKECLPLSRLPRDKTLYLEDWLQRVVEAEPSILPVDTVDERVQEPLVSLGMEIHVGSGWIDNLLISQNGYLVVVETKLWRNQEARREVVAQILDYAAQLRTWDYSKLEEQWKKLSGSSQSLWEHVHPEGLDEAEWIDEVNYNLSRGRMTLLIVGDGIRSESMALVKAVSGHPDFEFRLGLIELRLHQLDDGKILAIPTTIAKTVEIERVVVGIRHDSGAIEVTTPVEATKEKPGGTSVLTSEAFFEKFRKDDTSGKDEKVARCLLRLFDDAGFIIEWQKSSFGVKLPEPSGSGVNLSIALVGNYGKGGVYRCWSSILESQLAKAWDDDKAAKQVVDLHRKRLKDLGAEGEKDISVSLSALDGKEEKALSYLQETVDLIGREAAGRM